VGHGDDLLLLQHPDPEHAVAAGEDHLSKLVVNDPHIEGCGGRIRVHPEHGKDAVDIAEQERWRPSELVPCRAQDDDAVRHRLAKAELGRDVFPGEEVRFVARLQPLDGSSKLGHLLRAGPGRLRNFCCFAHISSLAPSKARIRLSTGGLLEESRTGIRLKACANRAGWCKAGMSRGGVAPSDVDQVVSAITLDREEVPIGILEPGDLAAAGAG
jgi:hypothetical protein